MPLTLRCVVCNVSHKANAKHFPLACHNAVTNKQGEKEDRIVGFLCRGCVKKSRKREMVKNLKIVGSTGGSTSSSSKDTTKVGISGKSALKLRTKLAKPQLFLTKIANLYCGISRKITQRRGK